MLHFPADALERGDQRVAREAQRALDVTRRRPEHIALDPRDGRRLEAVRVEPLEEIARQDFDPLEHVGVRAADRAGADAHRLEPTA